ncbi:ribbon-helix-helix domain-containing protein [Clostridium perfringens]|uniref:ribbon-helix-helix domain-containing protein n=1 Tax=Clostridium perfringens TaxID=1502 RepID=UPI002A30289C|nr:ribbon-helix-helix domain-containing protein [Clostridium perfringens]
MGNKQLKNRIQIGSSIDKELYSKLKDLSNETMIPMSKLLDKGISLVLKEFNKD